MNIRKVEVANLKIAKYNPRKNLKPGDSDYEKLKNSIQEFGYVDPIIWNETTGNVVGGHQRLKILKEMGAIEIDCVVVTLDENKEKALNLSLNKISGDWDMTLLKDLLKDLEDNNFNLDLTGFEKMEIDKLFERSPFLIEDDCFDADGEYSKITEPTTKNGDIWQLGKHRLICGDSADPKTITKLLDGQLADLIITDPPYNVDYNNLEKFRVDMGANKSQHGNMKNDNLTNEKFYEFLSKIFNNAFNNIKDGGAIYVFHSTSQGYNFEKAFCDAGFKLSEVLVWVKNTFTLGRSDYQWRHEPILYGWKVKENCPHYFINDRAQSTLMQDLPQDFDLMKKEDMKKLLKEIYQLHSSAICVDKPLKNGDHPTMKPIELISKLAYNSSREGELIFDPFGGSGTTLLSAEYLNRRCAMAELDETYCDVIIKRFKSAFPNELVVKLDC